MTQESSHRIYNLWSPPSWNRFINETAIIMYVSRTLANFSIRSGISRRKIYSSCNSFLPQLKCTFTLYCDIVQWSKCDWFVFEIVTYFFCRLHVLYYICFVVQRLLKWVPWNSHQGSAELYIFGYRIMLSFFYLH